MMKKKIITIDRCKIYLFYECPFYITKIKNF